VRVPLVSPQRAWPAALTFIFIIRPGTCTVRLPHHQDISSDILRYTTWRDTRHKGSPKRRKNLKCKCLFPEADGFLCFSCLIRDRVVCIDCIKSVHRSLLIVTAGLIRYFEHDYLMLVFYILCLSLHANEHRALMITDTVEQIRKPISGRFKLAIWNDACEWSDL